MPPPSSAAIVPRRPLRGLQVALEHPVAELAAYRQEAAEETGVDHQFQLTQAGQEQLVLHDAVLDAGGLGLAHRRHGFFQVRGDGFLAIDVLAGVDSLGDKRRPHLGGGGIEEDRVVLVVQRLVEICRPAGDAVRLGKGGDLAPRCGRPGSGRASRGRRSSG